MSARYASETSVSVEKSRKRTFTPEQKARMHEASRRHRARQREKLIAERAARIAARATPVLDECAWAAGLFEGEGTITMSGAKHWRVTVMMTSTDPEVVEYFQNRWPGTLRSYQPKGNAKLATSWTLASRDAVECFLLDIEFYVRTARVRAKLELALEELADRYPARRGADVQARSAARKAKFLELNRRGAKPQIASVYQNGSMPDRLMLEGPR